MCCTSNLLRVNGKPGRAVSSVSDPLCLATMHRHESVDTMRHLHAGDLPDTVECIHHKVTDLTVHLAYPQILQDVLRYLVWCMPATDEACPSFSFVVTV